MRCDATRKNIPFELNVKIHKKEVNSAIKILIVVYIKLFPFTQRNCPFTFRSVLVQINSYTMGFSLLVQFEFRIHKME